MNVQNSIAVLIIVALMFFGLSCQEKKDRAFHKKCADAGLIVIEGRHTRKYCGAGIR